jgi:hypothetical protein
MRTGQWRRQSWPNRHAWQSSVATNSPTMPSGTTQINVHTRAHDVASRQTVVPCRCHDHRRRRRRHANRRARCAPLGRGTRTVSAAPRSLHRTHTPMFARSLFDDIRIIERNLASNAPPMPHAHSLLQRVASVCLFFILKKTAAIVNKQYLNIFSVPVENEAKHNIRKLNYDSSEIERAQKDNEPENRLQARP